MAFEPRSSWGTCSQTLRNCLHVWNCTKPWRRRKLYTSEILTKGRMFVTDIATFLPARDAWLQHLFPVRAKRCLSCNALSQHPRYALQSPRFTPFGTHSVLTSIGYSSWCRWITGLQAMGPHAHVAGPINSWVMNTLQFDNGIFSIQRTRIDQCQRPRYSPCQRGI